MSKYKIVLKVINVKLNKARSGLSKSVRTAKSRVTKSIQVMGFVSKNGSIDAPESKTTCKVEIINFEACWTSDNIVVKTTTLPEQKIDIFVKIVSEKGEVIGELTLDISSHTNQVDPGTRKKFDINQTTTGKQSKSITVGLNLSISRESEKTPEEKQPQRKLKNNSPVNRGADSSSSSPITLREAGRRLTRPRSDSKTSETTKNTPLPDTSDSVPRDSPGVLSRTPLGDSEGFDNIAFLKSNFPRASLTQPSLVAFAKLDKQCRSPEKVLSSRERSGSLLGRALSKSARSNENEESKEKIGTTTESVNTRKSFLSSPTLPTLELDAGTKTPSATAPTSPTSTRLVQRTGSSPFTKGYTEPIPLSPTKSMGAKLRQTRRTHSESVGDINVSLLKQEYKTRIAEAAEKYLVDIIRMDTPSDLHVVAYVIWKSLVHWDAFTQNEGFHLRIANECERAVTGFSNSRIMLAHWLSTAFSLLCMTEEELKKSTEHGEEEDRLEEFCKHIRLVATTAFEGMLGLLQNRLSPVMRAVLEEVLSTSAPSMGDEMPPSLSYLFGLVADYLDCIERHSIPEEVKKQFFFRVIHYLNVSLMDGLVEQGGSYSQGLQLKLFITKLEDWTRHKMGSHYAKFVVAELEPLRQTANVLSLQQKGDLVSSPFRQTVCPSLRPSQVANLLAACRADQFATEAVPPSLDQNLRNQDDGYSITAETFDPISQKPLDFSFKNEAPETIALPKVILDQPAFAFLKPNKNQSDQVLSREERREDT